jgi:hypothetical protein
MNSGIRGLSITSVSLGFLLRIVSCSSAPDPSEKKTIEIPQGAGRPQVIERHDCGKFEDQRERENCYKARCAFEPQQPGCEAYKRQADGTKAKWKNKPKNVVDLKGNAGDQSKSK